MNDSRYKEWMLLHLRTARRETLTPEEQAFYQEGQDELYAEEDLSGNADELRQLRTHITEMESQLVQMMEEYRELKAKSEGLESQMPERTRQFIGVGS